MTSAEKKQNIAVILAATLIIVCSIIATLLASGIISIGEGEETRVRNVTFTDAVVTCRESAGQTYGENIKTLVTDNHSSRFDERSFQYKIFLQMDILDAKGDLSTLHYVNCFVRASNGKIQKFETFEEKESKQSSPLDDTNMFGIPKR